MRRNRHHGNAHLLLHLRRHRLRIVADDARHAGIGDKDRPGMICFHRITDGATQAVLPAEYSFILFQICGKERRRLELTLAQRCRQIAVVRINIHAPGHMRTSAGTVKDHHRAFHIGNGSPHAGHTAAARIAALHDPLRFNSHSVPPFLPTLQTPWAAGSPTAYSRQWPRPTGDTPLLGATGVRIPARSADESPRRVPQLPEE